MLFRGERCRSGIELAAKGVGHNVRFRSDVTDAVVPTAARTAPSQLAGNGQERPFPLMQRAFESAPVVSPTICRDSSANQCWRIIWGRCEELRPRPRVTRRIAPPTARGVSNQARQAERGARAGKGRLVHRRALATSIGPRGGPAGEGTRQEAPLFGPGLRLPWWPPWPRRAC